MRMKTLLTIAALGAVTLTACGSSGSSSPGPMPQRCNAAAHRHLIGTQVGAVNFPAGSNVRVVCTTCASTQDFQRDRLNIRFDQATGLVTAVDCG